MSHSSSPASGDKSESPFTCGAIADIRHRQRLEHLGLLACGTVHELKNLLMPMILGVELAAIELPEDHPAQASLATVLGVAKRAREIVRRFGEYGAAHRTGRPVSLDRLVIESVALLRPSLPSGTTITHVPAPGLPLIQADSLYAHQVITNILINASEALNPHQGEIEISLASETFSLPAPEGSLLPRPGNYLRLTIKDDGVGMDDATRSRIFEEFFTTKSGDRGRGLGLSIVREIMRESGGGLAIESAPGRGTAFHIYWPVAAGEHVTSGESAS